MFFLFKLTSATVINELLLLCGVPQGLILGSLVSFHRVPPGSAAPELSSPFNIGGFCFNSSNCTIPHCLE